MLELMRRGYSQTAITEILQKNSGLKGLSGISGDMRQIRAAAASGHKGAMVALDVFRHRLLQLIGSMASSLQALDVLPLAGGIGEHDDQLRAELKDSLSWLGDMEIVVIPADEEGMIARLCRRHGDATVSAPVG